jgi:16S rRNA processing protein RimM
VVETADGSRLLIERVRRSDDLLLVRFGGHSDRRAADALRGADLYIPEDERRPLGPGEFWPDELVGLTVRAPDGAPLGRVGQVVEGAAQFRLVVETPAGEVEVPFVAELVPEVDPAGGFLVVVPIEGLFSPPPAPR